MVRNPDDTAVDRVAIRLTAVGDEYGIYEDILYTNDDGVIYFYIPEVLPECKTLTLTVSEKAFIFLRKASVDNSINKLKTKSVTFRKSKMFIVSVGKYLRLCLTKIIVEKN